MPGSTSATLSAVEVNARQVGICRDLAHLGIALCRSLSIPARMVVGYRHRDDKVTAFAAEFSLSVDRDTLRFLDCLNRQLYDEFTQIHRHSGAPQTPAFTLQSCCAVFFSVHQAPELSRRASARQYRSLKLLPLGQALRQCSYPLAGRPRPSRVYGLAR